MIAISAMSTEPTKRPSTPGWRGADHTVSVKNRSLKVLSAHQLWATRKTMIETRMARTIAPLDARENAEGSVRPAQIALQENRCFVGPRSDSAGTFWGGASVTMGRISRLTVAVRRVPAMAMEPQSPAHFLTLPLIRRRPRRRS